jgi:hypothetical protein
VAGIDTAQEKNIFGYRGEISRPIPDADVPTDLPDLQIEDEVLRDRANILISADEADTLIDDVTDQLIDQLKDMDIRVEDPELLLALQRLGGNGDALTFGIYNRALNILRNAALASMCVDPVHLIFATSDESGPQIPRLPTKVLTCEEAANPALFDYTPEDAESVGSIDLYSAQGMQKQMQKWRAILLVWYGVGSLALKAAISALESIIRKLRWGSFVLKPVRRAVEGVRNWLRSLVCKFETKIYGRPLSNFCKGERRLLDVDDDRDTPVPEGTTLCQETDEEGNILREEIRVDPNGIENINKIDIEGWKQENCLAEEYLDAQPPSEGCPNFIPQECIDSALTIVERVHDWTLDQDNTVSGKTNPQAAMIWPVMQEMVDLHETGKFMLTAQDNSELSDKLRETTARRGFARGRWQAPVVDDFVQGVQLARTEYSKFSSNRSIAPSDCDE